MTSEFHTNELWCFQLPGKVGHNIHSVSAADSNSAHPKTASIGGVGVGTDQQATGEGIVLEEDLVDDTRTGFPEANVVLGARGGQKVVDLLVDLNGTCKILSTANLGLNQVVAVDSGGVGHGGHARGHELQNGHLGSGILAGHAIRAELEVGDPTLDVLTVRVVEVGVEDLLSIGQGSVEALANNGQVLGHLLVIDEVVFLVVVLPHLPVERSVADSGHPSHAHLGDCPVGESTEELVGREHYESGES